MKSLNDMARRIGETGSHVFLISTVIIGYEVAARYLFNSPTIWAHESVITLSAIGFLIGGVYAQQRNEHVRISIVYQILPSSIRRFLDVLNYFLMLIYLGFLGWGGFIVAKRSWLAGETSASAWNQPTPIIVKSMLVIAVVMMFILTCSQMIEHVRWKETSSTD